MWLGIDFGTCNSSAALLLDGTLKRIAEPLKHDYCFPSSIFVTGQGEILVGHAAENARQQDPQRYCHEFKRDLGSDTPYTLGNRQMLPEELITEVIRKLKVEADKVVKGRGIQPLSDAIITVPATYGKYKRDMMQEAGMAAGFSQVELLDEPVAAAIYYFRHAPVVEGEIVLVYDLGGGTFDATLVQRKAAGYKILAMPKGLPNCGGKDFDREIYQDFKQRCSESLGRRLDDKKEWRTKAIVGDLCKQIKHQLSEAEEAQVYIPIGDGESYTLTRQVFNGIIEPLIGETIDCCDQLVRSAGIEWQQVDRVLLVGGSCRIPYVQETVEEKFGRPHLLVDEPELAVCLGAAIHGTQWDEGKENKEAEQKRQDNEEQERQRLERESIEAEAKARAEVERQIRERIEAEAKARQQREQDRRSDLSQGKTGSWINGKFIEVKPSKTTSDPSQGKTEKRVLSNQNSSYFDIFEKVRAIIAEQLEVDVLEVKPEASFANDLGADSLDVVELVMALEEEFDLEISDETAEELTTVEQAVNYIAKNSIRAKLDPPSTDHPNSAYEDTVPTQTNAFNSKQDVAYKKLRDLLEKKLWKEADQETTLALLKATLLESKGYFDEEDISRIPCEDLKTVNQLWENSKGRFGFSIQRSLFKISGQDKGKFGQAIGWRGQSMWEWKEYKDLIFTSKAPAGQFPTLKNQDRGLKDGSSMDNNLGGAGIDCFPNLYAKLIACQL